MVTGIGTVAQPTSASVISSTTMTSTTGNPGAAVEGAMPSRRTSDNRRSNKPIMEKRRRARINNCLNELKTLILDAMKKDPARHSKLEKADILEMTVKHLENLQRQQVAMSAAADPNVINKFRAGFSECASEVGRFPGLEATVKRRLLQHLANCLQIGTSAINKTESSAVGSTSTTSISSSNSSTNVPQSVQVHILPTPPQNVIDISATQHYQQTSQTSQQQIPIVQHNGIFFTNGNGTGVQLVPTRLPNGDIALVLPTNIPHNQQMHSLQPQQLQHSRHSPRSVSPSPISSSTSPLPMLIPIPTRTASTASAASSTSSASSSSGYGGSNASHHSVIPNGGISSPQSYSIPSSPTHPSHHLHHFSSPYDNQMDTTPTYSPTSPMPKPLSLVMRKTSPAPMDEEKPWRPW